MFVSENTVSLVFFHVDFMSQICYMCLEILCSTKQASSVQSTLSNNCIFRIIYTRRNVPNDFLSAVSTGNNYPIFPICADTTLIPVKDPWNRRFRNTPGPSRFTGAVISRGCSAIIAYMTLSTAFMTLFTFSTFLSSGQGFRIRERFSVNNPFLEYVWKISVSRELKSALFDI